MQSNNIVISYACPEDVEGILALLCEVWPERYHDKQRGITREAIGVYLKSQSSESDIREYQRRMAFMRGTTSLIALDKECIIGYGRVIRTPDANFITCLAVSPSVPYRDLVIERLLYTKLKDRHMPLHRETKAFVVEYDTRMMSFFISYGFTQKCMYTVALTDTLRLPIVTLVQPPMDFHHQ